jgi:hypothetical protein
VKETFTIEREGERDRVGESHVRLHISLWSVQLEAAGKNVPKDLSLIPPVLIPPKPLHTEQLVGASRKGRRATVTALDSDGGA